VNGLVLDAPVAIIAPVEPTPSGDALRVRLAGVAVHART
jgi:hypothetical protein